MWNPMVGSELYKMRSGGRRRFTAIATTLVVLSYLLLYASPAESFNFPKRQIKSTITQQLKAFKNNDYKAAYQFASSHIQSEFSLFEFETMVRTAYPQIDKSLKISFGKITLFEEDTRATAIVLITGMDRTTVTTSYKMVLENGEWKNNGVINLRQLMPI